ncbi:hypothetical protein QTG54_001676 [Skeletonema marinoi]|uniref:F-box domain-containing protein n=1 Tax=Skeletonema marinoi TaxID=267567 RepID=A0AAD8YJU7_9STRA|nr:hypothetical protein QTG54_001676 [Skeletonema marinoi]
METNSSIKFKSNDTPQCDDVSNIQNLNLLEARDKDRLSNLPEDVLFSVLLYIGPKDVDESVKLVNQSLHNATSLSLQLWREFCILTGKCLEKKYTNTNADKSTDTVGPGEENLFRSYYFRNPCVPLDFETIDAALAYCSRTPMKVLEDDSEYDYSATGTVCLMPGAYKERLSSRRSMGRRTSGSDLWGGNTAVVVDGARAQVVMNSCVVQSHSGRGIVVTNQAQIQISESTVCDCAATGFYLGDWGSRAHVTGCNIVRNGFGSRQKLTSDEGRQELDYVLTEWTRAMCWIEDTLIASNCLTGTSVVRNGFLSLSGCDITQNTGNGHPISIEDEHDVGNNRLQGARIRGGVIEGPSHNDYSNSQKYQEKLRCGASFAYDALVRAPMTEEELQTILDAAV